MNQSLVRISSLSAFALLLGGCTVVKDIFKAGVGVGVVVVLVVLALVGGLSAILRK
jgi:hypothetical protein